MQSLGNIVGSVLKVIDREAESKEGGILTRVRIKRELDSSLKLFYASEPCKWPTHGSTNVQKQFRPTIHTSIQRCFLPLSGHFVKMVPAENLRTSKDLDWLKCEKSEKGPKRKKRKNSRKGT
jgi:hypothetical protein